VLVAQPDKKLQIEPICLGSGMTDMQSIMVHTREDEESIPKPSPIPIDNSGFTTDNNAKIAATAHSIDMLESGSKFFRQHILQIVTKVKSQLLHI